MPDLVTMPSFNAVAAGQTATLRLPTNYTYRTLAINYKAGAGPADANEATIKTDLEAMRLKVDGKVQRRFTATELLEILQFRGIAHADGEVPIFFAEPWARTPAGEDVFAWGTQDVATFELEVDIAAGAVNPTLSASAWVSLINRPLGAIVKWRKFTIPVTATGDVNVTTLPKRDAYKALHAFSGDVTAFEIRTDQRERIDADVGPWNNHLVRLGWAPQANVLHIPFDASGRFEDVLPMMRNGRPVNDFRVDFTMGAANSFDLITEVLGPAD